MKILSIFVIVGSLVLSCGGTSQATSSLLTITPSIQYQTISGWEATSEVGAVECTGYDLYKDELFDKAAFDLGITRIRVSVNSGAENPIDYYQQYLDGQITYDEWRARRHEIVNDNTNPNSINTSGFHFTLLDSRIEKDFLPFKQRFDAEGRKLFLNLNYVDFGSSEFEHKNSPSEYAEFVLATYQHLQQKYNLVPDAWEVILEPDTGSAQWSAQQVGDALVAAANRLQASGYSPYFIAPSTTNMSNAVTYFDQMIAVAGVEDYLKEISYHRYAGVSEASLQAIANRGAQYGMGTAMLEFIGATYNELHQDIKIGNNIAWQQYTLAYCTDDNGAQYYVINDSDPNNPSVNMGSKTKFLRQYFRYVLPGAVRLGASSNDAIFDPLAFKNQDGRFVVVVKATAGGSFQIQGLPAGRYGIFYTTNSQYNVFLTGVNLQNGQLLSASIPAAGVITVYAVPPWELDESVNIPMIFNNRISVNIAY